MKIPRRSKEFYTEFTIRMHIIQPDLKSNFLYTLIRHMSNGSEKLSN